MQIEVPSDQYKEAISLIEEKIKKGFVPGIKDPAEASNIVRKGNLSYKQAVNLAKAGTIDSLKHDSLNGVITTSCAAGISFVIDYASCVMNGEDCQTALKNASLEGLKTGGVVFATYVISSQIAKTGIKNALVPGTEAIAKSLGKGVSEALLRTYGVEPAVLQRAQIVNHVAKILRTEIITSGVIIVVLTVGDVADLFQGKVSKEQLLSNLIVTSVSVGAGTAGGVAGSAVGTVIAPGIGTTIGTVAGSVIIGGIAGFVSEKVLRQVYAGDAKQMYDILSNEFQVLSDEYLIREDEGTAIVNKLKSLLTSDKLKEMYSSDYRNKFAKEMMDPLFLEQVSKRKQIKISTEGEIRTELKGDLQGVVFIH